ncbi:hypothetical protein POWCR01_000104100 [Plasmodium ovale]|uniref:PIR protein n=1 Tax=Plasmodium ovale TaxID=36330 RepID=A0A1C3KHT8_PLAOA|nr:hypothetical protein POWCR01_000104100 [Plasmodium ovale]
MNVNGNFPTYNNTKVYDKLKDLYDYALNYKILDYYLNSQKDPCIQKNQKIRSFDVNEENINQSFENIIDSIDMNAQGNLHSIGYQAASNFQCQNDKIDI